MPDPLSLVLPFVRAWMDELHETNAWRAQPTSSFGFDRLAQYYPAALLDEARVVITDEIPFPPVGEAGLDEMMPTSETMIDGITFGDMYFIREHRAEDEALHFHELVHVLQWRLLGPDAFLLRYATEWLSVGYREAPLEVMAYDLQRAFESGRETFNVPDRVWHAIGADGSGQQNTG
ncbi:MAG: hypothetical protein AAF432_04410 [Planctomycetota bacterium]